LSIETQKKITIIPNVENKVFRKTEKVFDYISEKTVIFIHRFFISIDKQFGKAEEVRKIVSGNKAFNS
jgi:transcription-repair coupling factor (superfamily II helicase)